MTRVDRGRLSAVGAAGEAPCAPRSRRCTTVPSWPARRWGTGWPSGASSRSPLLPRTSAFTRTVAGRASAAQVVAANLDTVLVVDSLIVERRLRRVERYLAVAWGSGAAPVVVLTKADLRAGQPGEIAAAVAEVAEDALGVEVLPGELRDR